MKWFVRSFAASALCYALYFWLGWTSAAKDWQLLVRHLPPKRLENKATRKGVIKHLFYSKGQERSSLDIQARDSTLIVQIGDQGFDLLEDLEGVVGSFWDQGRDKAYTIFMPHALFDYPKKTITGYEAQLQEFDASTSRLLSKGSFKEVECLLKPEPQIRLRKIHAQFQNH
jgi:hypothetical protein